MVPAGRFELLTVCGATALSQAGVNPYDVELSRRTQSCLLTTRCQTPWHLTRKGWLMHTLGQTRLSIQMCRLSNAALRALTSATSLVFLSLSCFSTYSIGSGSIRPTLLLSGDYPKLLSMDYNNCRVLNVERWRVAWLVRAIRANLWLSFRSMILMGVPNKSRKWLDWVIAMSLAVASAGVVFWQNARLAVLWDLSYILENSYRISLGQVPYRDFPFPYAPVTFLVQAALIKLTGRVFFHHVVYCAVIGGLSTLLSWRILLKIFREVPRGRLLALILTAPLVVLGIYAIFPHPFYDPDCTFAVLVCLLLLLHWDHQPTALLGFMTGAALVVPVFVKQNTGLAFVASAVASLLFLFAIDMWRRRTVRKYFWLFGGLIVGFGLALTLVHLTAGLGNYIRWTVRFAAERRTPAFADMIGIYRDPLVKWWLAPFLVSLLVLWIGRGRRLLVWLSVIGLATPFVWSVVYLFLDPDSSERAERLIGLWPLVLLVSIVAMLLTIRRRSGIEMVLPLIVIGVVHGAFLSQQLWGSTYALWPFFMILVATIITALIDLVTKLHADLEAFFKQRWLSTTVSESGRAACLGRVLVAHSPRFALISQPDRLRVFLSSLSRTSRLLQSR